MFFLKSKIEFYKTHLPRLFTGAQFCVCLFLDSAHKSLNMFQKVSGFLSRSFHGFRVQIPFTQFLSAQLFYCGFSKKRMKQVVLDPTTLRLIRQMSVASAKVSGNRKFYERNPQMYANFANCKWIRNFVYY